MGEGERIVAGQKLLQATSDVFLGWYTLRDNRSERGFYVRQLYDDKASVRIDKLSESQLHEYGRVCAWTLARAHARSGHGAEIAGYLGSGPNFAESMVDFAAHYQRRNQADYDALVHAVKEGRVTVAS